MSTQEVSKIVNVVSFKVDQNSYSQAVKKIKQVASVFTKYQNQNKTATEQGRRIANLNTKATTAATRAEIRQQKVRKETLRADNVRYQQQIKSNSDFQKGLQKINMAFLQGNIGFKERSAAIGALTRQYRQLNSTASKHNSIAGGIKGIAGRAVGTAIGTGVAGAAFLGTAGYAANRGFSTVKDQGQQFEKMNIMLNNVFKERAVEISNKIAELAYKNGRDIVDVGQSLTQFVALMKPLGDNVDKSIGMFQKYQDMISSYGLDKEEAKGFMTQWTQALSQNTLDSYNEAMRQWNPYLKSDFEKWIKDKKGINNFLDNITGGKKYSLKTLMDEYLTANSGLYSTGAAGFKASSLANDARASNQISVAIYRIFESSGFKEAMKATTDILNYWGLLLESNASKIGEIFGNLYSVVRDLSKDGFEQLSQWLKELSKEDIKGYFGDLKTSMVQFADVMKRLVSFLDSVLPKKSGADEKGQYYIKREKYWLDQGYSGKEAGRLAEGEMRKQYQLGFTVPTLENSLVRMNAQNNSSSNHKATLDLKINTEINQPKINEYVWASIAEDKTRDFNMLLNGFN
ncbi:hypothetical protein [Aeromonas jandaei]|uniref:hypothetical protein n=1 Tax=Aeromonas jandaei TaxID=650 RepID=UPI001ABF45F1|nr:hypothetical protein [Aeromonas jandaei]QSR73538.1 hypothetical protein GP488_14375 [Aeromonas jandaei]